MKVLILAGGKGTRLKEVSGEIPKLMVKIGGIPLLEHQIRLLKKYDLTDILLLVNYLKDSVINHFGDGSAFGVNISYFEEKMPMGTAGSIKENEEKLTDDFLVIYGDIMLNMDFRRFIHWHEEKKSECTLAVHPNDHPYDSDLLETDNNGRITRFYPKPHDPEKNYPNLVNAGVYILSPAILRFIEKGKASDFGRDIFPGACSAIRMYGYSTSEYMKDMGTPDRFKLVSDDYASGKIKRSSYAYKQKAIFLDRDGVINEEISFISTPEDMRLYPFTAEAIRKINHSDYKAIVVTNQSVIARNLCTVEELKAIHNKLETDLGRSRARLDAIYYCPHHPDKGFPEERSEYKIECECRKPKPGMLLDAARDFNLDLQKSFIIGDSERDTKAGKNAGCATVGVMTGYGMKTGNILPDFFFKDLLEAVNFVVDEPYSNVFDKLKTLIRKKPAIILVGGLARSGKSNLASYLCLKFRNSGQSVLPIALDNWILPEKERMNCKNVYDRYQLKKIETDIQQILAGKMVMQMQYPSHPERKPLETASVYENEDIVIIEGVVALSSENIRNLADIKIYVDIDRQLHRERVSNYYFWKGKDKAAVDKLYAERLGDEYMLIEKERTFADLVVNSVAI